MVFEKLPIEAHVKGKTYGFMVLCLGIYLTYRVWVQKTSVYLNPP